MVYKAKDTQDNNKIVAVKKVRNVWIIIMNGKIYNINLFGSRSSLGPEKKPGMVSTGQP